MNREDLHIGMSVCVTNINHVSYVYNKHGVVIDTRCSHSEYDCLVEFDEYVSGHDGLGWGDVVGEKGHCFWLKAEYLEEIRCDAPEGSDVSYDDLMKGIL